jgi:hypothetical protein
MRPWTIGNILGPAVKTVAEAQPIGKLAAAITSYNRTFGSKTVMDILEGSCGDQFCVASTSAGVHGTARDVGLLYCGEGKSFLMVDFTARCFRLVECQLAHSRPNESEPRKYDLSIIRQGQELFLLPKAPRKVAVFWLNYAMRDED